MQRLASILLLLATSAPALADGGIVRHVEVVGPWRVTVFTSPTPVRAGPVDVSFLVQKAATGETVLDASIDVQCEGPGEPVAVRATRARATNRLLYAALFTLPAPGDWRFTVTVREDICVRDFSFSVFAESPLPPWQSYWPWFSLPILGLALFAGHQVLVYRPPPGRRGRPSDVVSDIARH